MPRKKTKKSKQKHTIGRQVEKKYTINNEQFFPTLVSVKKGHDEVVKQQIRLEKAKKLREFSWKYYRMQFSEDATLEKMLRSLKLSGITAPQELGGPAKKIIVIIISIGFVVIVCRPSFERCETHFKGVKGMRITF